MSVRRAITTLGRRAQSSKLDPRYYRNSQSRYAQIQAAQQQRTNLPSALATSSETTLEDFPLIPSTDPIVTSLNYATDSELIAAILAEQPPSPPPAPVPARHAPRRGTTSTGRRYVSPYDLDWKASIDPAFAFLALRTRPTFGSFMTYIRPRLKLVYDALRPSGIYQLFVSDVLIQSGDKTVVRELLQLDGEQPKYMRTSATVSLYEHIRQDLIDRKLEPLNPRANVAVSQALISEGKIELLKEVWDAMYRGTAWSRSASWPFIQIISTLARYDQVDTALGMLFQLLEDERIPKILASGRSNPNHPEAKRILVQSMVLRTLLDHRMYARLTPAADDLIETLETSEKDIYTHDLIMELCRTCLVGRQREQVEWAGQFLIRYAKLDQTLPITSSIINMCLQLQVPGAAAEWYLSLPEEHGPPSAINAVRLAHIRPSEEMVFKLLQDIAKLPEEEFLPQRGHFLIAVTRAKSRKLFMELYKAWKGTFVMTPKIAVSAVRLLTSGELASKVNSREVKDISRHFWNVNRNASVASPIGAVAIVQIHLLRGKYKNIANDETLNVLDTIREDIESTELKRYIDELCEEYPVEGYVLVRFLQEHVGLKYAIPVQSVIETCLMGDWRAVNQLEHINLAAEGGEKGDISAIQRRLIDILRKIRDGQLHAALRGVLDMHEAKEEVPISLYRGVIYRAKYEGKWEIALQAWLQAHEKYDKKEASAVSLLTLRRFGEIIMRDLRESIKRGENAERTIGFTRQPLWETFTQTLIKVEVEEENWDDAKRAEEMGYRERTRRLWALTESIINEGPPDDQKQVAHG